MGKVPDAKTLARIAQALGGEVIAELHRRLVEIAQAQGVIKGRKLRVDTTVVESNIHYPTDSSLLGDGTRVLTRTMKEDRVQDGRSERQGAGSHAQHRQASPGHCLIGPAAGAARGRTEKAAVSGAT